MAVTRVSDTDELWNVPFRYIFHPLHSERREKVTAAKTYGVYESEPRNKIGNTETSSKNPGTQSSGQFRSLPDRLVHDMCGHQKFAMVRAISLLYLIWNAPANTDVDTQNILMP